MGALLFLASSLKKGKKTQASDNIRVPSFWQRRESIKAREKRFNCNPTNASPEGLLPAAELLPIKEINLAFDFSSCGAY